MNGRVYEAIRSRREHRSARDLYHTALEVHVEGRRYIIENSWPIPNADGASRGVVVEGPVFSSRLGRLPALRYEIRCWRDGEISDAAWAVESPHLISCEEDQAVHLLDNVRWVPALVWGRRRPGTDEMWNSNSVVSWLLTVSGVPTDLIDPPRGGRAPGWEAGIDVARREGVWRPAFSYR
jgi:hypothetical protein